MGHAPPEAAELNRDEQAATEPPPGGEDSESPADRLDVHLLAAILGRAQLSPRQLCALSRLSRKWRRACAAPALWRRVVAHGEDGGNLYGAGLEQMQMGGRCAATEELSLTSIHVLERPNPWLHHGLELLLAAAPALRRLRLSFAWELPFADRLLGAVAGRAAALEELCIECGNCFFTDQALAALLRGCPSVRRFSLLCRSLAPIHGLTDSLAWQLRRKWPSLQALAVNAGLLSDNGLLALADCPDLQELALHGYRRGIFETAKSTAGGEPVSFPSLSSLLFRHRLPAPGELRCALRMAPVLAAVELQCNEDNEAGRSEMAALQRVLSSEFPSVACLCRLLPPEPRSYDLTAIARRLGIASLDKY